MNFSLDYIKNYKFAVDPDWVAKQFQLYDKYVREYYDPTKLLNRFSGISYNENGETEKNLTQIGDAELDGIKVLKDGDFIRWQLCESNSISNLIN